MGCGESKHDVVAFGNTILRRKNTSKKVETKDTATTTTVEDEKVNEKSTVEIVPPVGDEILAAEVVNKDKNEVESTVIESKEVPKEEDQQKQPEKLDAKIEEAITDHDHKEVGVDGIVFEDHSVEPSIDQNNVTGDQEQKPQQQQEANDQNEKLEKAEESVVKEEEKLENAEEIKEEEKPEITTPIELGAEIVTPVEVEVSTPVVEPEEEKSATPNSEEKHVVDSPTKDLKTV